MKITFNGEDEYVITGIENKPFWFEVHGKEPQIKEIAKKLRVSTGKTPLGSFYLDMPKNTWFKIYN